MKTLSNVNLFWKAICEQILDIRDWGVGEKFSSPRSVFRVVVGPPQGKTGGNKNH